jgi:hypothetical protein
MRPSRTVTPSHQTASPPAAATGILKAQMRDEATSPDDRPNATADSSWMRWTAIGIAGIWIAVVLISLFAPDFVSGSEQEHLPMAAFTTWFWGGIGTLIFLWAMGKLRGNATWRPTWTGLAIVTLMVWGAAAIVGIVAPVSRPAATPRRSRSVRSLRPRRPRCSPHSPAS